MDFKSLQSFDWRALQKYFSPQAADDLNAFLEKLPQHAGNTMLVVAGIVWAGAGALGLYTTVQLQHLTELRAEYEEAGSIKPMVPTIRNVPIHKDDVAGFVERAKGIYGGLTVNASGSSITISADSTAFFGQFREAIGHVQNGGSGWRVAIDKLCVGRECDKKPLSATLKINKVSVNKPG